MYKIEIYECDNLDDYDNFEPSKLYYCSYVTEDGLRQAFETLLYFYKGWQYRILTPENFVFISGAMDQNDAIVIENYLENQRTILVKKTIKSVGINGKCNITVFDCFSANATILEIEEEYIIIRICEDENNITSCYSCQNTENLTNKTMLVAYNQIAEIEPINRASNLYIELIKKAANAATYLNIELLDMGDDFPTDVEMLCKDAGVEFTRNETGKIVVRLHEQKKNHREESYIYSYTGIELVVKLAELHNFPFHLAGKFNELTYKNYSSKKRGICK